MEHRLNELKERLNNKIFENFSFSEERRKAIKEIIKTKKYNPNWDETTVLILMNTIHERSVTGFELVDSLQGKGDATFKEQEGALYTLLHRLEHKGLLCSNWRIDNNKSRKYYSLTSKGKRIVSLANKREKNTSALLRGVFEGVSV